MSWRCEGRKIEEMTEKTLTVVGVFLIENEKQ